MVRDREKLSSALDSAPQKPVHLANIFKRVINYCKNAGLWGVYKLFSIQILPVPQLPYVQLHYSTGADTTLTTASPLYHWIKKVYFWLFE
jgi:hypothetical protein